LVRLVLEVECVHLHGLLFVNGVWEGNLDGCGREFTDKEI
jgi:hypothetical protein